MSEVIEVAIVINNKLINYNLGVISLLINKFKKNEKLNILFIKTNLFKDENMPSLFNLYKKHLNIQNIKSINILITNQKIKKIDKFLLKRIRKLKFDILIAREQQNLMPVSDRLVASILRYNNISLLEDNLFGYYIDKKNNALIKSYYIILAYINNIYFILNNLFIIKNSLNICRIFTPEINTIRKISKNRKSVFFHYKKILDKERIKFNNIKNFNFNDNIKALVLLDLYHFKTKNFFSKKPSVSEIQRGIDIYFRILKKIMTKFKLNQNNIKIKFHPMSDEYLLRNLKNSVLGDFSLKDEYKDLSLELIFNNFKNLKFCFSIGSSSPIFLEDLSRIKNYVIKTNEIVNEPNYIFLKRLAMSNQLDSLKI